MKNAQPLDRETADTYAAWFKALADGTRVQVVSLLARRGAGERLGVFHSFTEDAEYGKKAIALGYLVSFSGMLTFRAAENIRAAAAGLPLDAMMVGTDNAHGQPEGGHGGQKEAR